jgi:hypothetical protein
MKATVIRIAVNPARPGGPAEYPGWIVPDTNDTLAIDERYPADPLDYECGGAAVWFITHMPTGFRVCRAGYTDADTRDRAVRVAQRFYNGAMARGIDLTSSVSTVIVDAHNKMTHAEREEFWRFVAVEPEDEEIKRKIGLIIDSDPKMHPAPSSDQPTAERT